MIADAAEGYYSAVSDDPAGAVSADLLVAAGELEFIDLFYDGENLVGLVVSFPAHERVARQQASFRRILKLASPQKRPLFIRNAQLSANETEVASLAGQYLSRVAIDRQARGRAFGGVMLNDFLDSVSAPMCLHVDRRNAHAISLYKKSGFEFMNPAPECRNLVMCRAQTS